MQSMPRRDPAVQSTKQLGINVYMDLFSQRLNEVSHPYQYFSGLPNRPAVPVRRLRKEHDGFPVGIVILAQEAETVGGESLPHWIRRWRFSTDLVKVRLDGNGRS